MDYRKIEALLDKYFEGQTTLEEEAVLEAYFTSADVADHLRTYQPLFQYFKNEKETGLSADFEKNLFEKIQPVEQRAVIRSINIGWVRIAASIALVIGGLWIVSHLVEPASGSQAVNWEKYAEEDPEKAYEETMKALALVSRKMNEGEEQTRKGFEKIRKANQAITE